MEKFNLLIQHEFKSSSLLRGFGKVYKKICVILELGLSSRFDLTPICRRLRQMGVIYSWRKKQICYK
ncbi:hypothetical protein BpHYR1_036936 [Brachionus plicatilis]|uniref:Uncharacterized protein n=1 Tax=Brachionus plicatilis TaxID=10195 RepID=A0A3M7PJC4_BRAPC|nr:hypothetical protein BpHYR1_036936 [Brachionus plicatilis]